MTGDYLCGKLKELADTTVLCCMDVKSVLKHVKLTETSHVFDTGIGVYLLNPLKSSYTFDDVAKEYLDGKLLPTREDLLGKDSIQKAWENPPKDWGPTPAMWHIQLWRPEDRSKKPSTRRKCGKSTQRSSFRWYLP